MRETTPEADARIARQLDALARMGRRSLSRFARRSALERAWRWAAPATLPAPLLFCVAGSLARIEMRWVLAASVAAPALVLVLAYAVFRMRHAIDRSMALSVFDERLRSGDRIGAADQFLREGRRDGFRAAAVQDAQPWIERALVLSAGTIVPKKRAGRARRIWLFPLVALGLLVLAMLMQRGRTPAPDSAANGTSAGDAPALSERRRSDARADGTDTLARTEAAGGEVRAGTSRPGPAQLTARTTGAAAPQAGAAAAQVPTQARSSSGSEAMQQGAGAATSREASAAAQAEAGRSRGAAAAAPAEAQAQQAMPSQVGAEGNEGAESEAVESRDASRQENGSNDPQQPAPPAGGPQNPAGQRNADEQGQQPGQPSQRNRSQQGEQGQSQGNGNARNPGREGQGRGEGDSLKRSRGMSGLLLGVPMRDRLTGTANPGRIKSVIRPSLPSATTATSAQAQARGDGQGDAGELPHRPSDPAEERLVRDYFMRQREGAGQQTQDERSQ